MKDCIFCMIVQGEVPAQKIYEDDNFLAFLDISPVNYGHTLIITKEHYENLLEMPSDLGASFISVTKKLAKAIMKATRADGFNLMQNNFSAAGQQVFHLHFHIIPRFENDEHKMWKQKSYLDQELMRIVASEITNCL